MFASKEDVGKLSVVPIHVPLWYCCINPDCFSNKCKPDCNVVGMVHRYQEALPYFVHACQLNNVFDESEKNKRLDGELLAIYRRDCLLVSHIHLLNL